MGGWSAAETMGGCWCGTRPVPGSAQPSRAATTGGCCRWPCCPTGGWSPAATTGGCWCGTRLLRDRPGRAGPPRRVGVSGGGAARRAGGHRRGRRAGAGVGPGASRRQPGSSWAATTARCGRWRCCPDGRVVTGGDDGRVLVWDPARPGTSPELGHHDGPVPAMAVLPGGRVVTSGDDGRVLVWDPAHPGTAR